MTVIEVKQLIEKYFEGDTTLQEEALLADYFAGNNIADELKQYQPLFKFFATEKQIILSQSTTNDILKLTQRQKGQQEVSNGLKAKRGGGGFSAGNLSLWWRAAAAVLIIGVSSYLITTRFESVKNRSLAENNRIKIYDESEEAEKALEEVQAALALVSKKMKKGTDQTTEGMKKVKRITDDVNHIIPISEKK